jgi:hypothetical protein
MYPVASSVPNAAGNTGGEQRADAARPISSASSRRAATSGISPRRTPPPAVATQPDTRSAPATVLDRHRQPPWRPHAADASTATTRGRAGNLGGKLFARQDRGGRKARFARGLTCTNFIRSRREEATNQILVIQVFFYIDDGTRQRHFIEARPFIEIAHVLL